jgi:DNA gyrase/topoisomerase IV subunit B
MSTFIELLNEIRKRPVLYIGSYSLIKLAAFLRGYSHAVDTHCDLKTSEFLRGFGEWIANKFSVTISQSWENIIQFQCADEKDAMNLFWRLMDEYLATRKIS